MRSRSPPVDSVNVFLLKESSVTIKVALKQEAGSLPVEGVNLTWKLTDPSNIDDIKASGTATTPDSGKVDIPMIIPGLDETKVYDLYVNATKTTVGVNDGVSVFLDAILWSRQKQFSSTPDYQPRRQQ